MTMNTTIRRAVAVAAFASIPLAGVVADSAHAQQVAPARNPVVQEPASPVLAGRPVVQETTRIMLAGRPVVQETTSAVLAGKPITTPTTSTKAAAPPTTEHVIVISIDGLRPDAIVQYKAKTLNRLMKEGSYTMQASTILPSKTLPSHTSMLTGTTPEEHGVTWNSEEMETHGHIATPTIFAKAKEAGMHTAAFFSKTKFEHLAVPGTLDHFEAPHNFLGKRTADKTVGRVEKYLKDHKPNLLFVHIGEPDFVGHVIGWMTDPYGWAVKEADDEVGDLLVAAEQAFGTGNYTVIVTADHGGHGRDHGSDDPRDVTIPWITWGKAVHGGTYLGSGIRTMDTAATALWLLGIESSNVSVGKPVANAYNAAPVLTAAQ